MFTASLSIGINPASAVTIPAPDADGWATVTGHEPNSSVNNKVVTWCGRDAEGQPNGEKLEANDIVVPYKLTRDYWRVVVKTGSNQEGNFANTVFGPNPSPTDGQWVWADTDGDGHPEIGADDKSSISHIIFCFGGSEPDLTTLEIIKQWDTPEGYPTPGIEFAGSLTVTVDGDPITEPTPTWSTPLLGLPVQSTATVEETDVPNPPQIPGFRCVTKGDPQYQVNGSKSWTDGPVEFKLEDLEGGNTVTVLNTVTCTEDAELKAVKMWDITWPGAAPDFTPGAPGTLTFNGDTREWGTFYAYAAGTSVTVAEGDKVVPPSATGYTCTITGSPTYAVGQGDPSTETPKVDLTAGDSVTVTVTNSATCTRDIPPPPATTKLIVTKDWTYTGVRPLNYTLTSNNAGSLTVTVGATTTTPAWSATESGLTNLKVGDKATVSEGLVPTPPSPTGFSCSVVGAPTYAVNGGASSVNVPTFPLAPTSNAVVVTNTVNCIELAAVDEVEDEGVEEDTTEEAAVAGEEDELAATGGNTSAALLGALLVLSGAALIGSRRRFGMNS